MNKYKEALQKILIVEHRAPLNGEDWIYISPKEWNVKDDFIVTKANNPIGWFDNLHDKDNYYTVIKTTEALEQSEPSEKLKVTGETSDGYHTFNELYEFRKVYNATLFNEWAAQGKYRVHKSMKHHDGELCFGGGWFIVVAVLPSGQISNHYEMSDWGLFDVPSFDKAQYEFDGHTSHDVIIRLQSLSPKEGKEEVRTYTYRELERFGIYLMSGDYIHTIANDQELVQYCKKQAEHFIQSLSPKEMNPVMRVELKQDGVSFEKFSLLPESSNPIATDHTTLSPNQTEAEKGSLRKIATEIMDKEYSFFTPDTRKKMVLSFCNGYTLARKQVIEEIEEFVDERSDRLDSISHLVLLKYLQTLKK